MRIEHLHYFLTIAEQQSITKAAQKLYISQPALSESLRNLEKELGFPLVVRSKRGITLTEDGDEFAQYAAEMYRTFSAMQQHFENKHAAPIPEHQAIHLIVTPLYARTYLQKVVTDFHSLYPYIDVSYFEVAEDRFFQYLQNKHDLLGLILLYQESLPDNSQEFHRILLGESPLVACCSSGNPLAAQLVTEMPTTPVVAFESSFSMEGFLQSNSIVTNSVETQIRVIKESGYIGVVPQASYHELFAQHNIVAVSIAPPAVISNCIFYQNKHIMSEAEQLFVQHLSQFFTQT